MPKRYDFQEDFIRRRTVHQGRAVSFRVDTVRLPNGKKATREYVDHPGAVSVLPFLDDKTVVLVEQYRYPVGLATLEIPAGKLDPGEGLLACVKRELREETGYKAARNVPLMNFWPAPAFSNEVLHIYLAEGLTPGPASTDDDEFLRVVQLPFAEALKKVQAGRIRDSKTVIAILAVKALGRRRHYNK